MLHVKTVKTITIRDLRLHWPATEKALQIENEIIITRDGEPVAKLVRVAPPKTRRKRWSAKAHMRWLKKMWGNRIFNKSADYLARDREDWYEWHKRTGK